MRKLIKGIVTDLDKGAATTSLIIQSGKRIFSVLMPTVDVIKADIELNRNVYCLINNKDITVFRDIKYFMRNLRVKDNTLSIHTGI